MAFPTGFVLASGGVNAFIKVCDVDSFDTIITDWDCTEEQIEAIEEKGTKITVVEESK